MAESRPKLGTITLKLDKKTERINIFGAEEWVDTTNGKAGRFRLRINGKWYSPEGEKYHFLTSNGLIHFLETKLQQAEIVAAQEIPSSAQLNLKQGDPVRFTTYYDGWPQIQRTRLAEDPYQNDSGDWCVHLVDITHPVLLIDVILN